MFHVRTEIGDGVEITIDLYEDEIFTRCIKCSKELRYEPKELAEILLDGGFSSTSVKCTDCNHNETG